MLVDDVESINQLINWYILIVNTFEPLGGPIGGGLAALGASAGGELVVASSVVALTTSRLVLELLVGGKNTVVVVVVVFELVRFGATANPHAAEAMLQLAMFYSDLLLFFSDYSF